MYVYLEICCTHKQAKLDLACGLPLVVSGKKQMLRYKGSKQVFFLGGEGGASSRPPISKQEETLVD